MDEYRRFVEQSATGEKPSTILRNRSLDHGAVIFENIFKTAVNQVKILNGSMNVKIFGTPGVIRETLEFLRRNDAAKIYVLHENNIDFDSHPWFTAVVDAGKSDRLDIARVPADIQKLYECHLCVSDNNTYRLEDDKSTHEAVVQFGDSVLAPQLDDMFEAIKKRSVKESIAGGNGAVKRVTD